MRQVILAVLVVLLFVNSSFAKKRDVEVQKLDKKSFEFRSFSNDNFKQLEYIKFKFDTAGFPRFRFDYVNLNKTSINGFTYRVGFRRLIEFAYNNAAYNGTQKVYQTYKLEGNKNWNALSYSKNFDQAANTTYHSLSISTADNVLTIKVNIADAPAVVNKRQLNPNSLKIDVTIANFPYTRTDTALALLTRIESAYKTTEKTLTSSGAKKYLVAVGSNGFAGFETTANTTEYGVVDVTQSGFMNPNSADDDDSGDDDKKANETPKDVAFTFMAKNSKFIDWDPVFGIGNPETLADPADTSAAVSTNSFALGGSLLLVLLVSLLM